MKHAIVHLDSGELAVVMHVPVFMVHVTLVLVYVIVLMDGQELTVTNPVQKVKL